MCLVSWPLAFVQKVVLKVEKNEKKQEGSSDQIDLLTKRQKRGLTMASTNVSRRSNRHLTSGLTDKEMLR